MSALTWACGITTVPERMHGLLVQTLNSLLAAGFPKPRLFIDGLQDVQDYDNRFGLEVTTRWPQLRQTGNWMLGLAELYFRNPRADRYLMAEDDWICCRGLLDYLERWYPTDPKGYQILYLWPNNKMIAGERQGWFRSDQYGRGAVADVFSREAVLAMLGDRYMYERVRDEKKGWKIIDGAIVTSLKRQGFIEYAHNPCLIQHTGTVSSMKNRPAPPSDCFVGENTDATLIEGLGVFP
jgi:hypothetical protein